MKKKAISPAELESIYSIPVGTLANLRTFKRGPRYFKIGAKVLYFVEDVEAWIRQNPVLTRDAIDIQA